MTVYLADTAGPVEREVVAAWVRERGEGSDMVPLTVPDIAARLQHGDDPPLVPVPVTWLPAGGPPALARRPAGAAPIRGWRRPGLAGQRRIVRAEPGRCQVVAGEPATVGELATG